MFLKKKKKARMFQYLNILMIGTNEITKETTVRTANLCYYGLQHILHSTTVRDIHHLSIQNNVNTSRDA
jgi:hypothetical protein